MSLMSFLVPALACLMNPVLVQQPEAPDVVPEQPSRFEPFPGIVVDREQGQIEVAGFVPIETGEEATPEVWVEVIAEAGGVRDHEALVGLNAEATQVHAALLLLGLEPGSSGLIHADGTRTPPTGPEVTVRVRFDRDGETVTEDPAEWVIADETAEQLSARQPRFYFGGSSEREFDGNRIYMAEAEGVVVGLSTFGTANDDLAVGIETVGMLPVLSPDTGSGDPLWLADPDRVPAFDTPVTLIIRRVEG